MRRIYKTTTAIVACLSMIAPQLAVAQAPQEQATDQQPIPPLHENPAPAGDAPMQAPESPQARQQQEQEQQVGQAQPEKPQKPRQKAEQQAPAQAGMQQPVPEDEAPPAEAAQAPDGREAAPGRQPEQQAETLPQPQAETPRAKPAPTQAEQPGAKPPRVEAEAPRGKPADTEQTAGPAGQTQQEPGTQPPAKPARHKAVPAADPAPAKKPQQELPRQDQPSVQATQPETGQSGSPDADALKKALDAEATGETAPRPGVPQPGEAGDATPPAPPGQAGNIPQPGDSQQPAAERDAGDPPPMPDAADLGRRLQEQQENQTAPGAQPAPPGGPQPGEIAAPETQVAPNDVARRAAESLPPAAAAALAAGDQDQDGKLDEVRITPENARRSDQDFETAIIQGLQADDQPREARREDDDDRDKLRDVGKLLLAGAAGFAVGKMLSNDREVALNTGDRVVVTLPDGSQQVIKDDNALLYQPGANVRTETFDDGSTRTTVLREDGSRVVTIRDANMSILRRTLVRADGSETRLIDDTVAEPVRISTLPAPPPVELGRGALDEAALREALRREAAVDRRFTLGQIRDIPEVRALVAPVNVPEITFDTGSSAITSDQAQQLATLGKVIRESIAQNPREIYMIEGYTDAVGSNAANLALSDRRAESVALALTEYFRVPPENMVVQGYGEQFLLVPSDGPERANRRVALRRITDLIAQD